MAGNNDAKNECGLLQWCVFIAAIVTGTMCSICSKTMMQLRGPGITGEIETFSNPIFQTFGMFVGMLFGLVMHWAVIYFQIPFPGYEDYYNNSSSSKQQPGTIIAAPTTTILPTTDVTRMVVALHLK